MAFTYVDLFAGIGGFHAALRALGGDCLMVSEIDEPAVAVYERNWLTGSESRSHEPTAVAGDINELAPEAGEVRVPDHDVLVAGFPCQPFSKSGAQEGVRDKTRGTLFFNILRILEERRPPVVLLENVRNLAGPRHRDTWETIVRSLREAGYRVSSTPTVFSPHLLPPDMGGTPQVRERVFIAAVYVGRERALRETDVGPVVERAPVGGWDPDRWTLDDTKLQVANGAPLLQDEDEVVDRSAHALSDREIRWIDAWDDFVQRMWEAREGKRLPGFPLWRDHWVPEHELVIPPSTPKWKADFLRKNAAFYTSHQRVIDRWLADWDGLADFPPSRRKFEWQAQQTPRLWDCVMHLRPSGIRAKRPTYLPALVAITQTSVIGPRGRRLTPREAARLQGLPDWFHFGDQSDAETFRQLGNAVPVGVVYHIMRELVRQSIDDVPARVSVQVLAAPSAPEVDAARTDAGNGLANEDEGPFRLTDASSRSRVDHLQPVG